MDISVTAAAAATTEVSIFSVSGSVNDNGGLHSGFAARSPLAAGEGAPPPAALPRPPPLTGAVGSGGGDRVRSAADWGRD